MCRLSAKLSRIYWVSKSLDVFSIYHYSNHVIGVVVLMLDIDDNVHAYDNDGQHCFILYTCFFTRIVWIYVVNAGTGVERKNATSAMSSCVQGATAYLVFTACCAVNAQLNAKIVRNLFQRAIRASALNVKTCSAWTVVRCAASNAMPECVKNVLLKFLTDSQDMHRRYAVIATDRLNVVIYYDRFCF